MKLCKGVVLSALLWYWADSGLRAQESKAARRATVTLGRSVDMALGNTIMSFGLAALKVEEKNTLRSGTVARTSVAANDRM